MINICSYCGQEIEGTPRKVGPKLRYCGTECYVLYCYTKDPGTALAGMVATMYPEIIAKLDKGMKV